MIGNKLLTITLLLCVALATYFLLTPADSENGQTSTQVEKADPKERTIATIWQSDKILAGNDASAQSNSKAPGVDSNAELGIQFNEQAVFNALQSVKLDENNNVILDNDALEALNSALESKAGELTEADIDRLQSLIEIGLPGIAGEQTAEIVGDYYNYLVAKQSFTSLYEGTDDNNTIGNVGADQFTPENKANVEERYEELKALRELYLGNETAEKLFAVEDANARYMFDSLETESNSQLSFDEKQKLLAKTIAQHEAQTLQIPDWSARQKAYLADKQRIIQASISDADKHRQLTELLSQQFTSEELAKIKHLALDEVNE